LTAAVVLNRRDQVRTAATFRAIRVLGEQGVDEPLDLAGSLADVFGASATMAAFDGDPDARGCSRPNVDHGHLVVHVRASGGSYGRIRLCREQPFSASERRLAGILGDTMARALEDRRLFEEVRSESQRDHLTGLLARPAFEHDLQRAVESAAVDGSALSLFLLDVDDLNGLNNRYGHGHGDIVLQRIARMLLAEAGPADRVYRSGDDEFAVVMPGAAADEGDHSGTRLRLATGDPTIDGYGLAGRLTASRSVGTAVCRDGACKAADLMATARAELAAVKAARREPVRQRGATDDADQR
jgi:diguanylate cyclase (GGDEF)-like protein